MKNLHNYWLPDDEEHFSKFILRHAKAGRPAEYQEPARTKALALTDRFNVSVDIGANLGLWSHTLEKRFAKNFAIEPIIRFSEYLKLNAPNSTIINTALGSKTGTVNMALDESNLGKTRISDVGETVVPIARLDDLDLPAADFIKIDVEGHELQVLLGGEVYIKSSFPTLVVEHEKINSPAHELLLSWGYTMVDGIKHDIIYKKLT